MKFPTALLLFFLLALSLQSCDPLRTLAYTNETGDVLEVELELRPNRPYQLSRRPANSSKIHLRFEPGQSHFEMLGIGWWDRASTKEFRDSAFKSITLIYPDDTVVYTETKDFRKILPRRASGIFRTQLRVRFH